MIKPLKKGKKIINTKFSRRTLCFYCRGTVSAPGWGTEIPQVADCAPPQKKSERWLPLREDEKLGITEECIGDIREQWSYCFCKTGR